MSMRAVRWIAVAVFAAAAPQARAATVQGSAGVVYSREDAWAPRQTVPSLGLDLSLSLGGFVHHPNLLTYEGAVGYQRYTTSPSGGETSRDVLDYNLHTTLFGHRASAFSASANASQREEDIAATGTESYTTISRSYGGDMRLDLPGRHLTFGYTRGEDTQHVPSIGDTEQRTDSISAALGQGGETFTYSLRYGGLFREGTFASQNANEHRVDVTGKINVGPMTFVQFSDNFFRRIPTTDSPFNPRQETNALQLVVTSYSSSRSFHQGGYTYQHGLQIAPLTEDLERVSHGANYGYTHILSNAEWRIGGSLDARYTEDRIGAGTAWTAGQTLGSTVQWRRQRADRTLDVHGGPQIGLTELQGGGVDVGYGAGVGASIVRTSSLTWQLGYDLSYASAVFADAGWSFRQNLFASADTALGLGHLSGQLTLSSERRQSAVFGSGGSRSVIGRAGYFRGRYATSLTASVSSGLSNAVSATGGDGLFLALPYDSHTYNLALSASMQLPARFSASTELQLASTVFPDRPRRDDLSAGAAISYALHALSLSLEERYVVVRAGGAEFRANRVLLTARRSFNLRF